MPLPEEKPLPSQRAPQVPPLDKKFLWPAVKNLNFIFSIQGITIKSGKKVRGLREFSLFQLFILFFTLKYLLTLVCLQNHGFFIRMHPRVTFWRRLHEIFKRTVG
jgi:hypothetical protein